MNILCLDQFSDLGGAQRCLLDLLPALAGRGWRVHVAAPGEGRLAERAAGLHATFDRIRCGPYSSGTKTFADMARFARDTPRLSGEIRRLIQRYDVDLVYVNGPRLLPAAAIAARNRLPVLFHAHSLLSGYARRLAGRSLAMAHAHIVASCRFVAAPLAPYAGDREVRIVYNGVPPMPPSSRHHDRADFRIGIIGRVSPEKGQADFLCAARLLHGRAPHCRFVICGAPLFRDPAAMRYSARIETLAVDLPVEFTGWKENVYDVLATLDLLVVPSAPIDATPRVILEAFASGAPVVAYASGGIPEIVEHGVTGLLVEPRSPENLACAIEGLLREPFRLREFTERARSRALRNFSLERFQAQMVQAVEAAL